MYEVYKSGCQSYIVLVFFSSINGFARISKEDKEMLYEKLGKGDA